MFALVTQSDPPGLSHPALDRLDRRPRQAINTAKRENPGEERRETQSGAVKQGK